MIGKIKKIASQTPIILVIGELLCFYPFVLNQFLGLGSETTLLLIALAANILLSFISKKKSNYGLPQVIKVCIIVQVALWTLYFPVHNDSSYITRLFFIASSLILLLYLQNKNLLYQFADSYNKFILLMALLGVPVFFAFALGLWTPLSSFTNIDGRECYFFGLTFSNSITAGICRVAGLFDEPGALAFWGIIAMIINKLFFDNKKIEIGLGLSLLTTLSAAYFVQITMYIILFYKSNLKSIFVIVLLLGGVLFVSKTYLGGNEQLIYMTVDRFQGGEIRSQRNELSRETKKIFAESPIIGIGAQNLEQRGYFNDNPYEILAKDGIIGFIVTYLPLLYVMFKYGKRNKKVLWATLILFAGYMQRPFHINLLHFFMFYLFCLLVYYKNEGYEKL